MENGGELKVGKGRNKTASVRGRTPPARLASPQPPRIGVGNSKSQLSCLQAQQKTSRTKTVKTARVDAADCTFRIVGACLIIAEKTDEGRERETGKENREAEKETVSTFNHNTAALCRQSLWSAGCPRALANGCSFSLLSAIHCLR